MPNARRFILLFLITLIVGCKNPFSDPLGIFGIGGGGPSEQPKRVLEATKKFSLAVGGVRPGRDELVIYNENGDISHFSSGSLSCASDDEDVADVEPRPSFDSISSGSGVKIVAKKPGVTAIRCTEDGVNLKDVYEVTIPPQSLIQILIAEAGGQISDEAEIDDDAGDGVVSLKSDSPTGDAVASVIRNRIAITNSEDDATLFGVDENSYKSDPPASYYDAVIFADGQFSPVNMDDPAHDTMDAAEKRDDVPDEQLVAYDQAVLTAAGVFNGDIDDPTGVSFAFRSPSEEEWVLLSDALDNNVDEIPQDSGFTDETFPSLAPIQILILPDVWAYDDRPSFVFARSRDDIDPVITNNP
jgi:hypothetical protein